MVTLINPTNWTNVTDFGGIMGVANSNTGGWFWSAILVMLFFIILFTLMIYGILQAGIAASTITLMLGIILYALGAVGASVLVVFLGLLVLTVLIMTFKKDS